MVTLVEVIETMVAAGGMFVPLIDEPESQPLVRGFTVREPIVVLPPVVVPVPPLIMRLAPSRWAQANPASPSVSKVAADTRKESVWSGPPARALETM
jgi:hypothetical protein